MTEPVDPTPIPTRLPKPPPETGPRDPQGHLMRLIAFTGVIAQAALTAAVGATPAEAAAIWQRFEDAEVPLPRTPVKARQMVETALAQLRAQQP